MKTFLKRAVCAWMLLGASVLAAQETIDLAAYIDDTTGERIGESNATALRNKISKIITRSGMTDAPGLFALVPAIDLSDEGTVDTGMSKIRVLTADVTLSVKNTVDNTVFASQTVTVKVNGRNDMTCMQALVNKLNVSDARFAKMLHDVRQRIADYYARQMPQLLTRVHSMVARGEYEDAMAALAVVPQNVTEYRTAEELKVQIYEKLLADEVDEAVSEAEILVRQGDIDGALNRCRSCSIASPNYHKVVRFMQRLDNEAAAAELAAIEAEQRKADAMAVAERKAETVAAADRHAGEIRQERAETCRKKGKSLGQWLFGL